MAIEARGKNGAGWALRSRLEKQPTDLRRRHYYMRDGALVFSVSAHLSLGAFAFQGFYSYLRPSDA
jgi:hypothetical protein